MSTIGPGAAAAGGDVGAAGVPLAGLTPPLADAGAVLPDATIASDLASPGASAFASTQGATDFTGGMAPVGSSFTDNPAVTAAVDWTSQPGYAGTTGLTGSTGGGGVGGATAGGDPAFTFGTTSAGNIPGLTPSATPLGMSAAPPAGATAPSITDQIGSTFGSIGSGLKSAAPWLGAAGLGYNLFQGYESAQAQKALQQQEQNYQNQIASAGQAALSAAQPMEALGTALINGGQLPPTVQAMFDQYRNAQRAGIIQGYASRGQNTDPSQNSALQQDLAAVDNNLLSMRVSLGNQIISTANSMLQQGVSATQIAAELPMMMQRLDIQLQQLTGNAIANFASAMSGGTMKVAGTGTGINLNLNSGGTPQALAA